jgi:hypothetical protein
MTSPAWVAYLTLEVAVVVEIHQMKAEQFTLTRHIRLRRIGRLASRCSAEHGPRPEAAP